MSPKKSLKDPKEVIAEKSQSPKTNLKKFSLLRRQYVEITE